MVISMALFVLVLIYLRCLFNITAFFLGDRLGKLLFHGRRSAGNRREKYDSRRFHLGPRRFGGKC